MTVRYDFEDRIRRLEDQLYLARTAVVDLLPSTIRPTFETYFDCKSLSDLTNWEHEAVDAVLGIAEPKSAREMRDYNSFSDRAYCPLCGGGASGPYAGDGYAFPEGLRRHLTGHGNVQKCNVFDALYQLYLDCARKSDCWP